MTLENPMVEHGCLKQAVALDVEEELLSTVWWGNAVNGMQTVGFLNKYNLFSMSGTIQTLAENYK